MRDDIASHLAQSVATIARKDATLLRADMTIENALAHIRTTGIGEKIIYFYVLDADDRLAGVVATRQLLGNPLSTRLRDIMSERVVALPETATLLEACEMFVLYKFLAFPVVDADRRVTGVIDISFFAQEVFSMSDEGNRDDVFETIGLHVDQLRNASPGTAFKHRFPWLLGTIASGSACALLAGAFETTLAHALTIAFFLPLVLGLNESVGMQSMSLSLQALHARKSAGRTMPPGFRRELLTALMLAIASAVVAGLIVWAWRRSPESAAVVAVTILASLAISGVVGFLVPVVLRRGDRDPKIAAGPITLAIVDIIALLIYFTLAMLALT